MKPEDPDPRLRTENREPENKPENPTGGATLKFFQLFVLFVFASIFNTLQSLFRQCNWTVAQKFVLLFHHWSNRHYGRFVLVRPVAKIWNSGSEVCCGKSFMGWPRSCCRNTWHRGSSFKNNIYWCIRSPSLKYHRLILISIAGWPRGDWTDDYLWRQTQSHWYHWL